MRCFMGNKLMIFMPHVVWPGRRHTGTLRNNIYSCYIVDRWAGSIGPSILIPINGMKIERFNGIKINHE